MTGNAGYLGMPTQSMKATVIDGSANSRGPWASVAGQTVTITALNSCAALLGRSGLHFLTKRILLKKRLRLWNFNVAEVASELSNLSSRSRKHP